MARYHGRFGALYVDLTGTNAAPTPVVNIQKWTIDHSTDLVEVTSLGDTNKVYVSGLADFKGTFTGFLDTTSADLYDSASDGIARNFYLYAKVPTLYWYGQAFFSQSASGGAQEAAAMSGTLTAAGAITRVPA
jgi:hypothetical protein